jgi:hypothetical protein
MAVTLNASTSTGLVQSADTSGSIELQTNGTTVATVNTSNNVQFRSSISVGNATPTTSGAGITFPASQSASTDANTLDDYEEGTWTPTLGGNATYTVQSATYTKVGNLVYVRCFLTVGTLGTGSVRRISGLPFTAENPADGGYVGTLGVSYYATAATSVIYPVVAVTANSAYGDVHFTTAAAASMTFNGTFFGNSTRIEFSGCYRVA